METKTEEYSVLKLENHRDRMNELVEGKDIFPITVELNITNRCNFQCKWCSERTFREKNAAATIPWQIVVRALKDMKSAGVRSVTMEGGGEPTIHPRFEDIVLADHVGLDLGLITNGATLRKFSKEMIERFAYIRVSLDASNVNMHEIVHEVRGFFDRVIEGIEKVVKNRRAGQVVGVSYVVAPATIAGMVEAAEISKKIGADYIQFKPLLDGVAIRYFPMGNRINEAKAIEEPPFRVYFSRFSNEEIGKPVGVRHFTFCRAHRLVGAVAATGDVMMCCNLKHKEPGSFSFGNLRFQTFDEIWRSEKRHAVIGMVEADPFFVRDVCNYCRMNEFNEIIERKKAEKVNPLWRVI